MLKTSKGYDKEGLTVNNGIILMMETKYYARLINNHEPQILN